MYILEVDSVEAGLFRQINTGTTVYKVQFRHPEEAIGRVFDFANLDARGTIAQDRGLSRIWLTQKFPGWEPGTGKTIHRSDALNQLLLSGYIEMVLTSLHPARVVSLYRVVEDALLLDKASQSQSQTYQSIGDAIRERSEKSRRWSNSVK